MVFFTNCDGRVDWGGWEGGGVAWCWIGDKELLDCDELMVSDGRVVSGEYDCCESTDCTQCVYIAVHEADALP